MRTLESRATEARYLSPGAQARSVTSRVTVRHVVRPEIREPLPLSWPGSRFRGFQPSTLTSSEPQSFPLALLYHGTPQISIGCRQDRGTHGSRSHIITMVSSLPLASHRPENAHLTARTGPVCIERVDSDLGGRPESSADSFRIGFVLHIRTLASSPPVAIREPSGCTWTEKIESGFGFCSDLVPCSETVA